MPRAYPALFFCQLTSWMVFSQLRFSKRGSGIPGDAEEIASFSGWACKRHAAEHHRSAGLNLRSGEEKFGLEVCQHPLDEVVLTRRHAAGEQEQIGLQAFDDQVAQRRRIVRRDG